MHILIPALHRPTNPTGVCRHAAGLALALAGLEAISKVTLLVGDWQKEYFSTAFDLSMTKIELISISIQNTSLARNYWFLFGLPKVADHFKPDIVHLSFPFPFIKDWFNCPVVVTIHDLYPYEYPQNFGYPKVWFNQWFLWQCVHQSSGISCVSNVTLGALEKHFHGTKSCQSIKVIYNSVDFDNTASIKPFNIDFQDEQQFLLCVAQHRKNKNLDLLISAFYELCKNRSLSEKATLFIVGSSGPETENIKNKVYSLNLENEVLFLSGLSDSELRWLYENCSAFVIPSSTEGFCLPLVEAQALGSPVVCSDIPILREVGSEHCHYFNLNELPLKNLMAAIMIALAQANSTKKYINPEFLKDSVAKKYLKLYKEASKH